MIKLSSAFVGLFIFTITAPNGQMFTITEVGGNAMVVSNQSTGKEIVVARQRNGVILMPSDGHGDFLDLERNTLTPLEPLNPFEIGD